METIYKINMELDIPIYQQLVDSIRTAIKRGNLVAGQQLPTVQEMTENLGIARGTVKRAYDELESIGLVEKVQGRGTFVRYQPANSASRKEQAMAVIDEMLNNLEDMGFSASEMNIFLNLKLREYSEKEANVKVAVVECNPENLSQISEHMRHISGVDLYSYTLESIKQYPYKLGEDFDLIVTTPFHAQYLESVAPKKKRIIHVALRPSVRCLSHIIKLRHGKNIGVIGYSKRFADLLYKTCQTYMEDVILHEPVVIAAEEDVECYLKGMDAILVPKFYEKYFGAKEVKAISGFKGEIIECYYEMDEGSVLYLEAKIKRLKEEKML